MQASQRSINWSDRLSCQLELTWATASVSHYLMYEDADTEVHGLGHRRELPSGWRSVGGAAKMIKAAEVQIRQGASMQQLDEFLQELCECYEVDKTLSEVRNSWLQWHVNFSAHLANAVPANLLSALWYGFIHIELNITFVYATHLVSNE